MSTGIGDLVTFFDDGPSVSSNLVVQLDDDALGGNPGGIGDDDIANTTGTLGFDFGGDGAGTITLLDTGAPAGFSYVLNADVLEVYQGAVHVLDIVINATSGDYIVTQLAPIDHPDGNNENNVSFDIAYRVTDNDGDWADGTLSINVDDDTPIANGGTQTGTVDEDGLPGGLAGGPGDVAGEETTAEGSVTGFFSAGADTPLTYGFTGDVNVATPVLDTNGDPVTSGGVAVTYTISGSTLTAVAGGTQIFTLTVDTTTGGWRFELDGPIDHPVTTGEDTLAIQFGSLIQATDADGDSVQSTGSLIVGINDDSPVALGTVSSGTVDEDGLAFGNPGGPGDVPGEAVTANGTVAGLFAAGADAPLTYGFTGDVTNVPLLDSNGDPVTSGGVAVVYSISGNTLTATAGGTPILTLMINQTTGAWAFELEGQLDHPVANTEDDLVLDFGGLVQATDFDGDSTTATGSLAITVDDDSPDAIDPVDITGGFANQAGNSATLALDPVLTVEDAVGADQPGTLSFNHTDGEDSGLDYQGSDVLLFVNGDVLEGRVGSSTGTLVFTVTLDQANSEYTFDLVRPIDNGSGTTFDDLSGTGPAGNPIFKIVDSSTVTTTEILFTPINASTVNSDSDDVAVDGQFIDITNPDAGLRIDFGQFTFVPKNGATPADYTLDDHETINAFRFDIDQISQGTTADIRLKAYDADDDKVLSGDAGDVQDPITRVTVYDAAGVEIGTYVRTPDGDPSTIDGSVPGVITFEPDGSVLLLDLGAGFSVETFTDDGYNRIEITNAGSGGSDGKFSLSNLAIGVTQQGNDVSTAFDLTLTDADGDSIDLNDAIEVTISPVAITPIVLDLDGDGAEFLGLDAGVAYDYGDGAVATAWVGADDGLLARVTASGLDIVFSDDAAGATTDLDGVALAYDSDGDGALTSADAEWSSFAVWQDANSNGVADAGEVHTLDDMGIVSIGLGTETTGYTAGNDDVFVYGEGSYATNDNAVHVLADASFETGTRQESQRTADQVVTAAAAATLLAAFDHAALAQVMAFDPDPALAIKTVGIRGTQIVDPAPDAPAHEPMFSTEAPALQTQAEPETASHLAAEAHDAPLSGLIADAVDMPDAVAFADAGPAFEAPQFAAFEAGPGVDGVMMEALLAAAADAAPAKGGEDVVAGVLADALAGSHVDAVVDAHVTDGPAAGDAPMIANDIGGAHVDLAAMMHGDAFAMAGGHPGAEGMEDLAVLAASAA